MPKVPTRKRQKHVKTHGKGQKKKNSDDSAESPEVEVPLQFDNDDVSSDDIPNIISPSPAPSCSSVASSSRPASSLSLAESENLDVFDDSSCISSPDPCVISPVLSIGADLLNELNLSDSGPLFQFQRISSPENTFAAGTSETPFKVPSKEIIVPYSSVQFHTNTSPQRRGSYLEVLLKTAKDKLELFLSSHHLSMVAGDALNIMYLSRTEDKVTQRQLIAKADGSLKLKVHCKTVPLDNFVKDIPPPKQLINSTVPYFVDRIVHTLNVVKSFEVCVGVSNDEYKDVWSECKSGIIDRNPYKESRYQETFRSVHCERLVPLKNRRCEQCGQLVKVLKRKAEMADKEEIHRNAPNITLTESQRLQEKIEQLLQDEGVEVDEDIANDFKTVLDHQNLTEAQSLFMQQQMKALKAKGPRGRRWHPAMIRFALSVFMKSPAAYGAVYDSGLLTLPSRRILFDYIHFKPVHDGIDYDILESVSRKVESMVQSGEDYKKYHVLMCDEMYISKNLVYKKATGKVVGFCSVDDVSSELTALQEYLEDPSANRVPKKVVASKVLAFLIKGVASDVKEVVAQYFVDSLTKEDLYRWT
ncbi:Ribosome maturation factor RimP [Frankliniella fusca]|uniref:Ribosome maturation factor RimP n=1 Tax=Frankliniella fusca TaxID=407009 RepID=A0AAE1H8P8_9NEOP|nr:Ribosome maturation factor RimP [Frankliniella fusca]